MTGKTNFFLVFMHGQSGGTWFALCCNNHPARMSVIGEAHRPSQLDFERRGLDRKTDYEREVFKFFEDRIYYGDACVGVMLGFTGAHMKFVREKGGKIFQIIRNPLYIVRTRENSKPDAAKATFTKLYGREPENDLERFEGLVSYYETNFYEKFLRRGAEFPIMRVEDLNKSLDGDGLYYKRVMEALTQTEWPLDYIAHIRENFTPAYSADNHTEWDEQGRVCKVVSVRRQVAQWGWRDNWKEDPYLSGPRHWGAWDESHREIYLKRFGELQKRLGYNQDHIGSTDPKWEFQLQYKWAGEEERKLYASN